MIGMNGQFYLPASEYDALIRSLDISFENEWENPFRVSGLEVEEHREMLKSLNEGRISIGGVVKALLAARK